MLLAFHYGLVFILGENIAVLCLMGQKVKNLVLQCAKSLSEQIQPNKSIADLNPDGGCMDLTERFINI
jgi:hypothetical protein